MAHPDYVVAPEETACLPQHEPVYGLTEGLPRKIVAKAVRGALEKVPAMPEWQDRGFSETAQALHAFNEALESGPCAGA